MKILSLLELLNFTTLERKFSNFKCSFFMIKNSLELNSTFGRNCPEKNLFILFIHHTTYKKNEKHCDGLEAVKSCLWNVNNNGCYQIRETRAFNLCVR